MVRREAALFECEFWRLRSVGGQGEAGSPGAGGRFALPEPGFLLSIHVAVEHSRDCRSALAGNDVPDVFGCFHHPGSAGTLQRF